MRTKSKSAAPKAQAPKAEAPKATMLPEAPAPEGKAEAAAPAEPVAPEALEQARGFIRSYLIGDTAGRATIELGQDKRATASEQMVRAAMLGKAAFQQACAGEEKAMTENRDGLAVTMGLKLNDKVKQTKKLPIYVIYRPFTVMKSELLRALDNRLPLATPAGEPRTYNAIRQENRDIAEKAEAEKAKAEEAKRRAAMTAEDKWREQAAATLADCIAKLATVADDHLANVAAAIQLVAEAIKAGIPAPKAATPAKGKAKAEALKAAAPKGEAPKAKAAA